MFSHPSQFEPLLPRDMQAEQVLGLAHDLRIEAMRLMGVSQTGVNKTLAGLLRSMNSYYSNKIEGEHTRPLEIEQAIAKQFSADTEKARLQRLALAHIETERWIFEHSPAIKEIYSPEYLASIHQHLFSQLKDADRIVKMHDAQGKVTEELIVPPGTFRTREVRIKNHVAPEAGAISSMLNRWSDVYGNTRRGEMQIIACAAAHHRLVWIHPFLDGNGRVSRLHSLAVLSCLSLTGGLWSPLRGLARNANRYNETLANADLPRMGDLDGRGQLSERMLVEWMVFFLEVCIDQVRFMAQMLNLQEMQQRLSALLSHEEHTVKRGIRMEALRPLHYLFATQGEVSRGDFASMTGLGEKTASTLIGKLLGAGLLTSDSPRGLVRFGIPMDALRFLFPNLWPEAEADASLFK